jgi:plastocyanin
MRTAVDPLGPPSSTPGLESATLSLAQVSAGQYDYYCMVHPYMTGKLTIVAAETNTASTANQTRETTTADIMEGVLEPATPPPTTPQPPQEINTSRSTISQPQQQQPLLQEQQSQVGRGAEGAVAIVSISFGSSAQTTDAYEPNPIQISLGETVRWVNDDAQPHTVTSGENATPDQRFDSGIMAPAATFEHTFTEAGEYPYSVYYIQTWSERFW